MIIDTVFIDNGEGRTGNDILDTQFFADSLYEGGLACSHLAIEGKDASLAHVLNKLACCSTYVV